MADKVTELAEKLAAESVPPHWVKETTKKLEHILRAELEPLLAKAMEAAHIGKNGQPMSNPKCAGCELAAELQGWRKP